MSQSIKSAVCSPGRALQSQAQLQDQRILQIGKKSRSGCTNCKRKRVSSDTLASRVACLTRCRQVKCDEQKPRCGRCEKHSLDCAFENVLRWRSAYQGPSRKNDLREQHQAQARNFWSVDYSPTAASARSPLQESAPEHPATAIQFSEWFDAISAQDWEAFPMEDFESMLKDSAYDVAETSVSPRIQQLTPPMFSAYEWTHQERSLLTSLRPEGSDSNAVGTSYLADQDPDPPGSMGLNSTGAWEQNIPPFASPLYPVQSREEGTVALVQAISFERPGKGLTDNATSLVEFYFHKVAPMFCCYENTMNPFQTNIGHLWTTAAATSLTLTIQSMSLACLAEVTPQLHPWASKLRRQAVSQLKQGIEAGESGNAAVYTVLLLGASAGWYRPKESMEGMFQRYKASVYSLFDPSTDRTPPTSAMPSQKQLFFGFLIYWDMYLSFMSSSTSNPEQSNEFCGVFNSRQPPEFEQPHPWTGVSTDIFVLTTCVGKLVRRVREQVYRNSQWAWGKGQVGAAEVGLAYYLEQQLLALEIQPITLKKRCLSPQDSQLYNDLIQLAEAYRAAALLQLYRVFEQLEYHNIDRYLATQPQSVLYRDSSRDERFQWMAVTIAENILAMPSDSSSLRFQLIPLMAAASELRMTSPEMSGVALESLDLSRFSDIRSAQIRREVRNRMILMQKVFPGNRMQQILHLVIETWRRLDDEKAEERAYWIDVSIEYDLNLS